MLAVSVLSPLVLTVSVLSMLVLAVMLTVIVRLSGEADTTRHQFDFGSNLLRILSTVTGQGWDVLPDFVSARVLTISSWVLGTYLQLDFGYVYHYLQLGLGYV